MDRPTVTLFDVRGELEAPSFEVHPTRYDAALAVLWDMLHQGVPIIFRDKGYAALTQAADSVVEELVGTFETDDPRRFLALTVAVKGDASKDWRPADLLDTPPHCSTAVETTELLTRREALAMAAEMNRMLHTRGRAITWTVVIEVGDEIGDGDELRIVFEGDKGVAMSHLYYPLRLVTPTPEEREEILSALGAADEAAKGVVVSAK